MEPSANGAHLQQFVSGLQCVRLSIPQFAKITAPLHEFLEKVYRACRKRTRQSVARIALIFLGWGEEEENAFRACKQALAE